MRIHRFDKKKILLFLSVLGPGIITANVDNDAGGIATYSIAGAHFGYTLLWTLIPITVALIVVQEMVARMGVVTGKTLADLVREKFGVRPTFFLLVALVLANLGNTVAEFAGWAAALEIFGVSKYISVPIGAAVVWFLVVKGTYRIVEKVFLFACTIYFTYIVSAVFAHPRWGAVAADLVTPHLRMDGVYVTMLIGLVGTTIAPWMQFYLQSAVVEKNVQVEDYKYCRTDVVVGCIMTDVVALFIIVACGATLFANGVRIEGAKDAALALTPLAGKYASTLFAIGLANASLFAASILPLSTAYCVCEGMGWESGIDKDFRTAPQFFWLYTGLIFLGGTLVLYPRAPLMMIMYLSQVINGVLLPFVLIFMLKLINDGELMGEHVNSKAFNGIAWTTTVVMIVLTALLVVVTVFPGLPGAIGL
ncbi:Nramp family divalent metal transporter [Candidatus Deferrimicrobium sp.]|uniref:Nramp family divalent metal transporter n=1 Tax=Candidatus Deferrimicrobium sp. TaxID=3060586 RepID=UPI002ED37519